MRKTEFAKGQFYHVYNRGVDKRIVFEDRNDIDRFFQSMGEFNTVRPIGSIYENSLRQVRKGKGKPPLGNLVPKLEEKEKLVNVICYCLNPNHYHMILEQLVDGGIGKYMHKLGVGYTNYFNEKYKRTGSLFQGTFKAVHINSDAYLLHLSAYVNLNNHVHRLAGLTSKSSWKEYAEKAGKEGRFCEKRIILSQFKSTEAYKIFARESLKDILKRKDMESLLLE